MSQSSSTTCAVHPLFQTRFTSFLFATRLRPLRSDAKCAAISARLESWYLTPQGHSTTAYAHARNRAEEVTT
eukprot:46681-Eustigmatos_ZCMA.PRE.1